MTTLEVLKRQTYYGGEVFEMLLLLMNTAIKAHKNTGRCVAQIAMDAYHYGVMQGKRAERTRSKRNK